MDKMQLESKLFYYEDLFTSYKETAKELLRFYGMAHVIPIKES